MARSDNRAVSSIFRVFGGNGVRVVADKHLVSGGDAMHAQEARVLAFWIPVTVLVALADVLVKWQGAWVGCLLAVPVTFVALNVLPFLLPGRSARLQWQLWFSVLLVWAVFHVDHPGIAGWVARFWAGIAVLSAAASSVRAWRFLMDLAGWGGVWVRIAQWIAVHLLAIWAAVSLGWWAGVFVGGMIGAASCAMVLRPASQALGRVYRKVPEGVLVTLDDGPDPHDTPQVLDLLDRYQMKAVFFMIGRKVEEHPELAREVIRRGHEIGNHTMTHPQRSFWCAGPVRTWKEIEGCQKIIEDVTGVRPKWFRAPVGHRNLFTHPIASALGLRVMGWTCRGYDAVGQDPERVVARVRRSLKDGAIVLIHESTPIAVEVVGRVLAEVQGLGGKGAATDGD